MGRPSPEKGRGNRHQLQIDTTRNRRKAIIGQTLQSGSFALLRTAVVHRLGGALVVYFNFALAFGVVYRLIEALAPGSFRGVDPGERPDELALPRDSKVGRSYCLI